MTKTFPLKDDGTIDNTPKTGKQSQKAETMGESSVQKLDWGMYRAYDCPTTTCSRRFLKPENLTAHMKTVHLTEEFTMPEGEPDRNYEFLDRACAACGEIVSKGVGLNRHITLVCPLRKK